MWTHENIDIIRRGRAVRKRLFEKIRKLRVMLSSILASVVIFLFLAWIYDTYDQQTMLLWLAILIAATTALINTLSLDKTRQSLDLTRQSLDLMTQSVRPFLTFSDVRYSPRSQSVNPRILLIIGNTGPLPAYKIDVSFELGFEKGLTHGQTRLLSLKPDESRDVEFTLPPDVKERIPDGNSVLEINTAVYLGGRGFYHTERHYSIPPNIKVLNQPFDFDFRGGGEHD